MVRQFEETILESSQLGVWTSLDDYPWVGRLVRRAGMVKCRDVATALSNRSAIRSKYRVPHALEPAVFQHETPRLGLD